MGQTSRETHSRKEFTEDVSSCKVVPYQWSGAPDRGCLFTPSSLFPTMSASGWAHSRALALTSSMCTQGLLGWVPLLALAATGWQEEGWKEMVSLVRTKPTMKSFKGQQQLESHLEAQRQPARLAEQWWDMLRTKFCLPGRRPLVRFPNGLQGQPWAGLAAVLWSGSQRRNYTTFLIQKLPGPANAYETLLFGLAANWASNKFPKLRARSTSPWLCAPGPSICDCYPALLPFPAVPRPGCPHPARPHYSCCYYGRA